jgi:hypothetical protein
MEESVAEEAPADFACQWHQARRGETGVRGRETRAQRGVWPLADLA